MDFHFTPEEEAFRATVRRWIEDHPPERFEVDGMDGGYGSGPHSRDLMQAVGRQGWLTLTWPKAYGGEERPFFYRLILLEELALAGAPFGPLVQTDQSAESIMQYGSERLKSELLRPAGRGELLFWQGFSEPEAGSDLLSLKTHARREGDHYVLNGHKIWSSHAGIGDYGFVLARTDPRAAKRHLGISMFVVGNDAPGLEVRPIMSMAGQVYHYETFIDEVRVHRDYMLGAENEGFVLLLRGLDSDRFWGRFYKPPTLKRILSRLGAYARATDRRGMPLARDPEIRRTFARLATDVEVLRTLFWRVGAMLRDGAPTPYETALYKVYADETGQKIAAFGMDLLGMYGPLAAGSPWEQLEGEIRHLYLTSMGQTIAGGTSEVLRTTVATRGLGLPRSPRAG